MKVSIIIPIYNEEKFLPTVLKEIRKLPFNKELILVNDCSQDRTQEILTREEKEYPDTLVIHHIKNLGKGFAIRSGLEKATGDIIIIQDADMEYNPEDIIKVIKPIEEGKTRVSYGSRFLGSVENMRFPNYVANKLLAWIISLLYFHRITDEATAYKAFHKDVIHSIRLDCQGFEFCPEITSKVLRLKENIIEVPVTFKARSIEEGKKIGWRDFFVALKALIKYRFQRKEKFYNAFGSGNI